MEHCLKHTSSQVKENLSHQECIEEEQLKEKKEEEVIAAEVEAIVGPREASLVRPYIQIARKIAVVLILLILSVLETIHFLKPAQCQ